MPEAVGDTGVLVNPINIDELKRAIVDLLHNLEERANYTQKGLERVRLFGEKRTTGEFYRRVVNLLEGIK